MEKIVLMVLSFLIAFTLYIPRTKAMETTDPNFCSQFVGVTKIWWNGVELKKGQMGRLTVLKDTPLYKVSGETKTYSRTLKKGEFYRIYAFKPGMLSVGGGYYVIRDAKVSYETPSKTKLAAVACISMTDLEFALQYLNSVRTMAGLKPVKLNNYLNKAAKSHADYLSANSIGFGVSTDAHYQTKGKKGFTGVEAVDRVIAAGGGNLAEGILGDLISFSSVYSMQHGIVSLIDAPLHRPLLIDPTVTEIGIGANNGITVVVPYKDPSLNNGETVYPYNGMTNVKTEFLGRTESPNPLEKFKIERSGYVITYSSGLWLGNLTVKVTDSQGKEIPVYKDSFGMTWLIIPKTPLLHGEKYTVKTSYSHYIKAPDGYPSKTVTGGKTWSFTTIK